MRIAPRHPFRCGHPSIRGSFATFRRKLPKTGKKRGQIAQLELWARPNSSVGGFLARPPRQRAGPRTHASGGSPGGPPTGSRVAPGLGAVSLPDAERVGPEHWRPGRRTGRRRDRFSPLGPPRPVPTGNPRHGAPHMASVDPPARKGLPPEAYEGRPGREYRPYVPPEKSLAEFTARR